MFRKVLRGISKPSIIHNNIINDTWFGYFSNVFIGNSTYDKDLNMYNDDNVFDVDPCDCHKVDEVDQYILESPITEHEIQNAIFHLNHGKVTGIDNIIMEMLKVSENVRMPFLKALFNRIFSPVCFQMFGLERLLSLLLARVKSTPPCYVYD